jgi:hypothetical protein
MGELSTVRQMGISISYKGSLSDPTSLDEVVREVRSFCRQVAWECEDFSEHYSGVVIMTQAEADGARASEEREYEPWPESTEGQSLRVRVSRLHPPPLIEETVRGVVVTPPDSDSLRLAFDCGGRLVRYLDLPAEVVINAIPDTNHYIAMPHWLKTTGAPATHAALCALLRMLKGKYMKDLEVSDETGFWKSGNVARLEFEHAQMGTLVGVFQKSLSVGGLLNGLGMEVPENGRIQMLDPRIPVVSGGRGIEKRRLN